MYNMGFSKEIQVMEYLSNRTKHVLNLITLSLSLKHNYVVGVSYLVLSNQTRVFGPPLSFACPSFKVKLNVIISITIAFQSPK